MRHDGERAMSLQCSPVHRGWFDRAPRVVPLYRLPALVRRPARRLDGVPRRSGDDDRHSADLCFFRTWRARILPAVRNAVLPGLVDSQTSTLDAPEEHAPDGQIMCKQRLA
ncbi:hypothetical protein SPHINGO8AM_80243 [Sphingomonas sp. 8AM]|nr:hypothetical protein SPHINGO8AM_80243 [Sphingomonas sp. 8AM]